MATILYLTDLYYVAKGRNYYEEDLYITSKLKDHFDVLIGHPQQALSFLHSADLIVFRNTGPVMAYKEYFRRFVAAVQEKGLTTFNSFDGKADTKGKDYLLQLTRQGLPVIPTVDTVQDLEQLGNPSRYMLKLKDGADSIGMRILTKKEIAEEAPANQLIQPYLDFVYEVSFYYLNNQFQYALYAPDKESRWLLKEYSASPEDLSFAEQFINWNKMSRGISRVDACRMQDGSLLLVELEDLNPYLSIDVLDENKREAFLQQFITALKKESGLN